MRQGIVERRMLNEWWRGRTIPASREGIKNFLQKLQITDTQVLIEKCMGLEVLNEVRTLEK